MRFPLAILVLVLTWACELPTDSEQDSGPQPGDGEPLDVLSTVCIRTEGEAPDPDGVLVRIDGESDRQMTDGCETWLEAKSGGSPLVSHDGEVVTILYHIGIRDVAPHCTPADFYRFDEPWDYWVEIPAEVVAGEAKIEVLLECGTMPEVPWGRFELMLHRFSSGYLPDFRPDWPTTYAYSIDGGPVQYLDGALSCTKGGSWIVPGCRLRFPTLVSDLPIGDHTLSFPELPEGAGVCWQGECTSEHVFEVKYGKTTIVILDLCTWQTDGTCSPH